MPNIKSAEYEMGCTLLIFKEMITDIKFNDFLANQYLFVFESSWNFISTLIIEMILDNC